LKEEVDRLCSPNLTTETAFLHCGYISTHETIPWISLSEERPETKTQFTHYGSSLHPEFVRIYVSSEGAGSYGKFINACSSAPKEVAMSLAGLQGCHLRIRFRTPVGIRKYVYDNESPLCDIKCPPEPKDVEYIAEHWNEWFGDKKIYPGVFVIREFDKAQVLKEGPRIAARAAEAISDMRPYRDLIHDWRIRKL
jgi:hypothetical protein